jgi:uncharacterized protein (DUF885 family)
MTILFVSLFSALYPLHLYSTPIEEAKESSDAMLERHFSYITRMRPVHATRLGLGDEEAGSRVEDAMDEFSGRLMREWRRNVRKMRAELNSLAPAEIDPLTRAAIDDIYDVYLGGSEIPFGFINESGRHRPYVINQIDQPLQYVPKVMITFQRVETAEQAADYLRRLWSFSGLVDSVLSKFNTDADAGWIAPRPILEGALGYIDSFVVPDPADHELVTTLMDKVDDSDNFSATQREQIHNEAKMLMATIIYPSFRNASRQVRDRLPEAKTDAGVWAQPLGEQFYKHSIRHEARTNKSAGEIHDIGLAEVDRLLREMDTKLESQGYSEGSVGERMHSLAREKRFLFEDSEAGREQLLERLNEAARDMRDRLPAYVGSMPREDVEIRPFPKSIEAGAPGGQYDGPPADGGGPGIFWINLRDMGDLPWFRMPTLTYHETLPGHHLQVALARSQVDRPMVWRFHINSAYSEGWALYAEALAEEMGVYGDDALADLGRLQAELFRAVRLVVDTGMHHKRWSREKAIEYMQDITGRGETDVTAEIERYMAWPGQALAYKLGMIEIQEIRREAEARLGDAFNLREFHDRVLETGGVSMPLLREQIMAWVESQQPDD